MSEGLFGVSPMKMSELTKNIEEKQNSIDEMFEPGLSKDFLKWVTHGGECPTNLNEETFKERVPTITILSLMLAIKRIMTNAQFVMEAESVLFNKETFSSLDSDTQLEYYVRSSKELHE